MVAMVDVEAILFYVEVKNHWTLIHLKYARHVHAGDGDGGSQSRSFGKEGEDKVIEVPCGTVVYDAETGEFLCDITHDGEEVVLVKGGRGGQGKLAFPHGNKPNSALCTTGRTVH